METMINGNAESIFCSSRIQGRRIFVHCPRIDGIVTAMDLYVVGKISVWCTVKVMNRAEAEALQNAEKRTFAHFKS